MDESGHSRHDEPDQDDRGQDDDDHVEVVVADLVGQEQRGSDQ